MLSPRNDVVLHCVTYRNTSFSSKTHKYYIGFCRPYVK